MDGRGEQVVKFLLDDVLLVRFGTFPLVPPDPEKISDGLLNVPDTHLNKPDSNLNEYLRTLEGGKVRIIRRMRYFHIRPNAYLRPNVTSARDLDL